MLISDKQKFIFVHVPKVAGISIVSVLKKHGTERNNSFFLAIMAKLGVSNKMLPHNFKMISDRHIMAVEIKKEFGDNIYNKYTTFGFVRNPWDWEVSHYHYILKTPGHPKHGIVKSLQNFEEFVKYGMVKVSSKNPLMAFLCDKNGNLIVDYIGRFEQLSTDLGKICKKIGIESEEVPHKNKSVHKKYQSYYNEKTIELVRKHHEEDLKLFKYNFDNENLSSLL